MLFPTAIAGSLPKPAWLAETHKLWPQWKADGKALEDAKRDATLLWLKLQEDAGLDIVGDGEMFTRTGAFCDGAAGPWKCARISGPRSGE